MDKRSIALNKYIDRVEAFLPSFEHNALVLTLMKTVSHELLRHHDLPMSDPQSPFAKYENVADIGTRLLDMYREDEVMRPVLYDTFHSKGLYRPLVDDFFDLFWDFAEDLVL